MRTRIRQTLLFGISFMILSTTAQQERQVRSVSKRGMQVQWYYENDKICFEMNAPTEGWVTIGFNETSKNLTGAYLLMGRVINRRAEVVEHYTSSPGNYTPIESLGGGIKVSSVTGQQKDGKTLLRFSLPLRATDAYRKNLLAESDYTIIMAYSQEDDFQHHSIMRTATRIKL